MIAPDLSGSGQSATQIGAESALPLIVLDVNETLLDLQTMEPVFQRIFGEQAAMRLWFANFIMYSAALTVAAATLRSRISVPV